MDFKKVFHIIHQVIHMAVGLCHPNYAVEEGEIPPKTMCFCAKCFIMAEQKSLGALSAPRRIFIPVSWRKR
jgi:hypothetical protein